MATTYNHVQLGVVDVNGNVDVLYPQNTAEDVSVDRSSNARIPSSVTTLLGLVNNIGEMAFVDKKYCVFLGEGDEYTGDLMQSEINDTYIGKGFTWSSEKITQSTPLLITSDELSLIDLTAVPTGPRIYCVDGTLVTFASSCPENGYLWKVEYTPIIIKDNVVMAAYQKWTGISEGNKNGYITSHRNYLNGTWGSFYNTQAYASTSSTPPKTY